MIPPFPSPLLEGSACQSRLPSPSLPPTVLTRQAFPSDYANNPALSFLRRTVLLAVLILISPLAARAELPPPPERPPPPPPSKVFYAFDTAAIGPGREFRASIIRRMIDTLVMAAAGRPTVAQAWQAMVKPTDTVGIKVSAAPGRAGGARHEVAAAVAAGLRLAGLPREKIIIWDRNREDLIAAGYRADSPDYTLRWIDPAKGYDTSARVVAPVLGKLIWGDSGFGDRRISRFSDLFETGDQLSSQSHFARILVKEVTRVIHIASASDSIYTGIHGALADMTLSNIDNWRRFTKAPDHGDPYIAEIYADETIRSKVALTFLDALVVQYAGGPHPNPHFTADNGAIFASRDPVALDATLIDLIEPLRKAAQLPPVRPMSRYVESAQIIGLGEISPSRIETVRVGVEALNR